MCVCLCVKQSVALTAHGDICGTQIFLWHVVDWQWMGAT